MAYMLAFLVCMLGRVGATNPLDGAALVQLHHTVGKNGWNGSADVVQGAGTGTLANNPAKIATKMINVAMKARPLIVTKAKNALVIGTEKHAEEMAKEYIKKGKSPDYWMDPEWHLKSIAIKSIFKGSKRDLGNGLLKKMSSKPAARMPWGGQFNPNPSAEEDESSAIEDDSLEVFVLEGLDEKLYKFETQNEHDLFWTMVGATLGQTEHKVPLGSLDWQIPFLLIQATVLTQAIFPDNKEIPDPELLQCLFQSRALGPWLMNVEALEPCKGFRTRVQESEKDWEEINTQITNEIKAEVDALEGPGWK